MFYRNKGTGSLFQFFCYFAGRPIAVDWAIPKQQYATLNNKTEDIQTPNKKPLAENIEEKDNSEEESNDEEEDRASSSGAEEGSDDNGNTSKEKKNWKGDSSEVERKSDVGEGKTLFIRNLDFTTTKDSLKNFMEKFGSVHYALLCMDKVMERPKGTGFVKFIVSQS